jgi:alkylation response protein AidB-like acyl-CoA dehydrogenase
MHNLQLTDDQTLIVDTVRKFVQDTVEPHVLERDERRESARAELAGLGELGLFGLPVPESDGGVGLGLLPLVAACEEIGAVSASLARLLATQVQCATALARAGGGPLGDVLGGGKVAAWIGVEHGATRADGRLTATCELVPGAAEADVLVVAVRDGGGASLFAIDAARTQRTGLRTLGLASAAPARVLLAATEVTALAEGAAAEAAIGAAEVVGWIAAAATCVGTGRAAVTLSHRHARERIAFGKPLLAQQAVARKLVESRRAIDAARHLAYHAARLADRGDDASGAAIMARIAATDAAVAAADEGIQIHGGFGYTVEYHVERHYRDAKTIEVLDGGNERLKDRLAATFTN